MSPMGQEQLMKKRYRNTSTAPQRLKLSRNHRRGSAKALIAVLIAAAAVGGGAYYWYQTKSSGIYASSDGKPMLEGGCESTF
jgi:uncharacterized protein HemX